MPAAPNFLSKAKNFIRHKIVKSKALQLSDNQSLGLLKNLHINQPAFVIGNGPSLNVKDLELIKQSGAITIGSNKIFLIFNETEWRPDYYTVADWCVIENNLEKIKTLNLFKLFPTEFIDLFAQTPNLTINGKNVFFKQIVPQRKKGELYYSIFTEDLRNNVFVGETITNFNIQLANHLGCNPIYTVGLDGTYTIPKEQTQNKFGGTILISEGETNHFHKDYRNKGETWSMPNTKAHEVEYSLCVKKLQEKGKILLNASRKTAVKSIPKIDFDSLFPKK